MTSELEIALRAICEGGGVEEVERLRLDLNQYVGAAAFVETDSPAGAKGVFGIDWGTLVVSLLGTQGVVALANTLGSYFNRRQLTEVEISGPGGSAKISLPPNGRITSDQIEKIINSVLEIESDQ